MDTNLSTSYYNGHPANKISADYWLSTCHHITLPRVARSWIQLDENFSEVAYRGPPLLAILFLLIYFDLMR